ncbi:hypothetical protein TVAG_232710 [Trichomonas vaginalis G3]|uniref:Uncharacterized protein n=1 Tax=Trichomonas vaginalis (strain ATCC PRA-98 / G3) TaxID=412133 RepID=A2EUA1_TRIV3|nr:hypothetical protein TVAGG3_1051780 [Trichomonas vaginalis G3]EAY03788.1 hypothetical protein TVAG_232710 [Trichomonas vaginalis G3]KAI5494241.1 hypothetical protein TVAGG3_1051780 [Trichomonas vaginalis G3]|eukprot:XP_001316011.1 hypothetical protein [Trichomonas vaginalis G3]
MEGDNIHPLLLINESSRVEVINNTIELWEKDNNSLALSAEVLDWILNTFSVGFQLDDSQNILKERLSLLVLEFSFYIQKSIEADDADKLIQKSLNMVTSSLINGHINNSKEIIFSLYNTIFEKRVQFSSKAWEIIINFVKFITKDLKIKEYTDELSKIIAFMYPLSKLTDNKTLKSFRNILEASNTQKSLQPEISFMIRSIFEYTFPLIFDFSTNENSTISTRDFGILSKIESEILLSYLKAIILYSDSSQDKTIFPIAVNVITNIREYSTNVFLVKFPLDQFFSIFSRISFLPEPQNFECFIDLLSFGYLIDKNWKKSIIVYLKYILDYYLSIINSEASLGLPNYLKLVRNFVQNERIISYLIPYILKSLKDNNILFPIDFLLNLASDSEWITQKILQDNVSLTEFTRTQGPFSAISTIPSIKNMVLYFASIYPKMNSCNTIFTLIYYYTNNIQHFCETIYHSLDPNFLAIRNSFGTIDSLICLFYICHDLDFIKNLINSGRFYSIISESIKTKMHEIMIMILIEIANVTDIFSINEGFRQHVAEICRHNIVQKMPNLNLYKTLLFKLLLSSKKVSNTSEITRFQEESRIFIVNEYLLLMKENPSILDVQTLSPYGVFSFQATPVPFSHGNSGKEETDNESSEDLSSSREESLSQNSISSSNKFDNIRAVDFLYNIGIIDSSNTNKVQYIGKDKKYVSEYVNAMVLPVINVSVMSVDEKCEKLERKSEISPQYRYFLSQLGKRTIDNDTTATDFALFTAQFHSRPQNNIPIDISIIFIDGMSFVNAISDNFTQITPKIAVQPLHKGAYAVYLIFGDFGLLLEDPIIVQTQNLISLIHSFILSFAIKFKMQSIIKSLDKRLKFNENSKPQSQPLIDIVKLAAGAEKIPAT